MNRSSQKGMVLLVSLMLLLMLTLIAIAASSRSTLQLRISSNNELTSVAFQSSEAGLAAWIGAYLALEDPEFEGGSNGQAYSINKSKSNWDIPCPGGSIGMMSCFDIQSDGGASCDANGQNCLATASHRQGGKRREPLSSAN